MSKGAKIAAAAVVVVAAGAFVGARFLTPESAPEAVAPPVVRTEQPAAADTLGINVYKTRYICVIVSGMLAGIAGASITLDVMAQFTPTAVAGQGFIALAAVIFGKWKPMGAYFACLIFGFAQALTVVLGGGSVAIPSALLAMLPYVLTIVILILFVGKSVAPKADGIAYEKGKR